jgi:predicted NBD/HSP70 family sugar kinase
MSVRSVQHDNVREHNRHAVLQALRSGGELSRAALAQATGLSVPTVATIVQELAASGLVGEAGLEPSGGGRPARRLKLMVDARNVLACDLGGARARAARVDLAGGLHRLPDGPPLGAGCEEALASWLEGGIDALEQGGYPVALLALAVPGVVEPVGGHVRLAPSLGWSDMALGAWLLQRSGREAVLENDVNALALAELNHGIGAGRRHVLYLAIAGGIGAGLVVDGALYRGAHAAAGEIGYSLAPGAEEGPLDVGRSGPLERHLLAMAEPFMVDGLVCLRTDAARAAFDAFAERVRESVHDLACALDPELVVVAWACDPEGRLAEALRRRWQGPWPLDIRPGTLGDDAALRGVASLALERLARSLCGLRDGRAA